MRTLSGGVIPDRLYNIIRGTNAPETSADAVTDGILSEFEKLGGGERDERI